MAMIVIILLILVLLLVVLPIWQIMKIRALQREDLLKEMRLDELERRLDQLQRALPNSAPAVPPTPAPATAVPQSQPELARAAVPATTPPVSSVATPVAAPAPVAASVVATASAAAPGDLPPLLPPAEQARPIELASPEPAAPRFDWEQFMGAKLFAWLGGLAALLGVGFFVKYSFDHDLVPPEVRIALGYLFATGLVVGGLKIRRDRYATTSQTLIATGIVCLYAVTFATNSVYHFAWFGPTAAFAVMSLVTLAAFLLAVRLEARVIAVLGILGGFLTPVLLSTGQDNPPGLFGYLALLDVGLIAVALHRRWLFLLPLGAAGTVLMQLGWAGRFLTASKAPTAMIVSLGFCALFTAACGWERRRREEPLPPALLWSAVALPMVAFLFALKFLRFSAVTARPELLFTFVLLADACLFALAWLAPRGALHLLGGGAVFTLLGLWTAGSLTAELLPWALFFYLIYAALHTGGPLWLVRSGRSVGPAWLTQLFPILSLLLLCVPLAKLTEVSLLFWPAVLVVDVIAIGLAVLTASVVALAAVLVLTLVAAGLWILQAPVAGTPTLEILLVIGGIAVGFWAAGLFLARRFGSAMSGLPGSGNSLVGDPRTQIPALSSLLPFVLLVMATQRLALANPSPVFGLALLLVVLTLGLARLFAAEWLPACALAGVTLVEFAWWSNHQPPASPAMLLGWMLGFHSAFALYPFLFRAQFTALTGPWAIAALSGIAPFPIIYRLVKQAWPNDVMGLLPACLAVPPLLSLLAVVRQPPADERARLNQLAWFGGATLFFITLIFPLQFSRQWHTLGWAFEGVALLWLFHRVPHPGLRGVGVALLLAAFVRLTLNPAVLAYHPRTSAPLFNWYLYTYGAVVAALFLGARLLAPPRERVFRLNFPPVLQALGTVLAFVLVNLEIADFFSEPGSSVLTFQFSGNFARDMTYTIAWALFAFGLLLVSLWKELRLGRYAAIALLGVALVKLFFHDLAQLEALYRVGALLAVAAIATLASFAYQKFLPAGAKPPDR